MPRGGRRPGAGRPKGAIDKVPRRPKISAELVATHDFARREKAGGDLTPLDVMLKNMRWADQEADETLAKIIAAAPTVNPADALKQLKEVTGLRALSQKCASEAAPYVHPKINAVPPPSDDEPGPMKDITPGTAEERDHLAHLTKRFSKFATIGGGEMKKENQA